MSKIVAANETKRTISPEVMKDVAQFLPMDSLELTPDMLNQEYTVVNVLDQTFNGGRRSFTLMLRNDERTIPLSASVLRRARVLNADVDIKDADSFKDNKNIFSRSKATEIWDKSSYFHAVKGMNQEEELVIPEKLYIRYAILSEAAGEDGPALNPMNYKGYMTVVRAYQAKDANSFPTFDQFKEELAKTGEDRIPGLPANITTPEPLDHINTDKPSAYRYSLVFKDIADE